MSVKNYKIQKTVQAVKIDLKNTELRNDIAKLEPDKPFFFIKKGVYFIAQPENVILFNEYLVKSDEGLSAIPAKKFELISQEC